MTERNADFWNGVEFAKRLAETEAHDLQDIRDGYIEARKSGVHAGRRIPAPMAHAFAGNFHERSDAVYQFSEQFAREIEAATLNKDRSND